jgi:hypothetical protein
MKPTYDCSCKGFAQNEVRTQNHERVVYGQRTCKRRKRVTQRTKRNVKASISQYDQTFCLSEEVKKNYHCDQMDSDMKKKKKTPCFFSPVTLSNP